MFMFVSNIPERVMMDKTILSLNWNAELLANVGHTECHHGAIVSCAKSVKFSIPKL